MKLFFRRAKFLSHRILYLFGVIPKVEYEGIKIYYEPETDCGKKLFWIGGGESKEIALLKRMIKPSDFIVDVGANIGDHSVPFAKSAYLGVVVAFEPGEGTFAVLEKNAKIVGNIKAIHSAVSDRSGKVTFNESVDSGYSSVGQTGKPIIKSYDVPASTIDDCNFDRLDLLKIDVEGHEMEVISGALKTIRQFKPLIFCEIDSGGGLSPEARIKRITDLGYRVCNIIEGKLEEFKTYDPMIYNFLFIPIK